MADPRPWTPSQAIQDATCEICPAQLLRFGRFDVAERPGRDTCYDPANGWRANAVTGAPTCVHPYRVGLAPALYASAGVSLPEPDLPAPAPDAAALELPDDPTLLEAWFVAVLRTTPPAAVAAALGLAETTALARFDDRTVVAAIRRVMSTELPRVLA